MLKFRVSKAAGHDNAWKEMNIPAQPSIDIEDLDVSLVLIAKTSGSVVLDIRKGNKVQFGLGWLNVHHPCDGHICCQIRGMLPDRLLNQDDIRALVTQTLRWLDISTHETWEISVCSPSERLGMAQSINAEGESDRIESTRRYRLPKDNTG